jgi:hypothetical protein
MRLSMPCFACAIMRLISSIWKVEALSATLFFFFLFSLLFLVSLRCYPQWIHHPKVLRPSVDRSCVSSFLLRILCCLFCCLLVLCFVFHFVLVWLVFC